MYNVTDQDAAQKSRYLNIFVKFDAKIWSKWADKNNIDGRCINFVLMNPEIVKDEVPEVNARSLTIYFNSITSIKDFNSKKSLEMIQLLGEGSLGSEITATFTSFIHNNMDKMISAEDILNPKIDFENISKEIKDLVKSEKDYRADIAYVLTTRLMNYIEFNLKNDDITNDMIKRLGELISTEILGSDLKFILARRLANLKHLPKLDDLIDHDAYLENVLE